MSLEAVKDGVAKFTAGYMDRAITDPEGIIEELREQTKDVEYDTIVGTGSSGTLIVPIVARALGKHYLIIRKKEEAQSSHSGVEFIGNLGKRWIFLDDFCSSGQTFRRVRDKVLMAEADACRPRGGRWNEEFTEFVQDETPVDFGTELVGYFEYERGGCWYPWDEDATPGYDAGGCNNDTPKYLAAKAKRESLIGQQIQATDTTPAGDPIPRPRPVSAEQFAYYTEAVAGNLFVGGSEDVIIAGIDRLEPQPGDYDYRSWGDTRPKRATLDLLSDCGISGCIACNPLPRIEVNV